jgi:glycosyltransferase involved in cell wall biosynthesis
MITILMPIYNGIEFINESVESIIGQTYEEWELIIGINGYPEGSKVYQIAKTYENENKKDKEKQTITVLDLHFISGKSEALNEMVKYAKYYTKYDHIALLDVDDIWDLNKLEIQIPFVKQGYDVIGSRCIYFGTNTHLHGVVPNIPTGDISDRNFFEFNPIINSSAIIKKEHCMWDGYWNGIEDYNMWLQLRMKEKKFYNCEQILVKHRIHQSSAFNSKGNGDRVPELLQKYR